MPTCTIGELNEMVAAWNSYQRLGKLLNRDPVALAEADVLGKLYEANVIGEQFFATSHGNRLEELAGFVAVHDAMTKALATCREAGR